MPTAIKQEIIELLTMESDAIRALVSRVDNHVEKAVSLILHCTGKIVVTGMGKTGIIGRKISATLASTGTSSIYLHPAEAIHGDLGMVNNDDVVIAITNSGETRELIDIIPYITTRNIPIICLTGNVQSTCASMADVIIDIGVPKKTEPLELVPMSSTTTALAMGNAIATVVLRKKQFRKEDYALLHPGGSIGKRLLIHVSDIMHTGDANPIINLHKSLREAICVMTSKGLGCVSIITDDQKLAAILTDGDLKRILQQNNNPLDRELSQLTDYSRLEKGNPKTVLPDTLGIIALEKMEKFAITVLPVVDKNNNPIGLLHMHDLIRAGIV